MEDDERSDSPYKVQATAIAESEKALKVRVQIKAGTKEMWVPKSCIHDGSEVFDNKDNKTGKRALHRWFADEEGLEE